MKVALLHYWLTNMRGGENVLAELSGMFPEADIFTHAYSPEKMDRVFGGHRIIQSFIGKLPMAVKHCQKYLPLMPMAVRKFNLAGYDLIISSESGPVKGIRKPAGAVHICYCHTPMRYIWDMYDEYYKNAGLAGKIAMTLFRNYLRRYDRSSADSVDFFIANSRFVAERIRRLYNRNAEVIYPPVNTAFFRQAPRKPKGDFYLYAGQLIDYKKPELALESCLKLGRKLVFIGDGDRRSRLEQRCKGNPDIVFAGRVSNEELLDYYAEARALLFPGVEDFGIVPLEAQAAGTPVIAFGKGGALETVVENETGLFFDRQTADSLCDAIIRFENKTWEPDKCRQQADRFSIEVFRSNMAEFIKKTTSEKR